MQFIESTAFGVRSAYWTLTSENSSPTIHIFPMVHIGDQTFYDTVFEKVSACDIILVEGVKSKTGSALSFSYRNVVRNKKLGLVLQPRIQQSDTTGEIVHADVSGDEFDHEWSQLSLFSRMKLMLLLPMAGLYWRKYGSREKIAKSLHTEYAPSRRELLSEDLQWEEAKEVLLTWRDSHLLKKIDEQIDRHINSKKDIAIIYGALHMRAVIKYLIDVKGYRVRESEWVTVIAL